MAILLLILLGLAVVAGAAVVGATIVRGRPIGARAVGPLIPAAIDFFDVQPRHICSGDTLTASWRARGESGNLTATLGAPVSPFLTLNLANPQLAEGSHSFPANVGLYGAVVELEVARPGATTVRRDIRIPSYDGPNAHEEIIVQAGFTTVPRAGWIAQRTFSADLTPENDSWSTRIGVQELHYREGDGRDVIVIWNGRSLASLSPARPDSGSLPGGVTIVGDWVFFAEARPGDGPSSHPPTIHINFTARCPA